MKGVSIRSQGYAVEKSIRHFASAIIIGKCHIHVTGINNSAATILSYFRHVYIFSFMFKL